MTADREFVMEVRAYGLTSDAEDALFDRVADSAHALDEQVTCSGQTARSKARVS